jgi:hypothetical protein
MPDIEAKNVWMVRFPLLSRACGQMPGESLKYQFHDNDRE